MLRPTDVIFQAADSRWRGYWHSFRVDHYAELPKVFDPDKQMFRPK